MASTVLTGVLIGSPTIVRADAPEDHGERLYEEQVFPLIARRCVGCHRTGEPRGGLDLTSPQWAQSLGDSETSLVDRDHPEQSWLLTQVTPDEQGVAAMPPEGDCLTADEVATLRKWIAMGAPQPASGIVTPSRRALEPPVYRGGLPLRSLDVSPDGNTLAVAGAGEVVLLDARHAALGERRVLRRLVNGIPRVVAVRFSPDGQRIAVAGGDVAQYGEVQIWRLGDDVAQSARRMTADIVSGVSWSPDGSLLAVGGVDARCYLLASDDLTSQFEIGAHADWALATAFSVDGKFVVSGGRDHTLRLSDASTGRFIDALTSVSPNIPLDEIYAVRRHPQRDQVAAVGRDGVIRTYMLHRQVERKIGDDNQLVHRYPGASVQWYDVAYAPDGRQLAAVGSTGATGLLQFAASPDAWLPPEAIRLIQAKTTAERTSDEAATLETYHTQEARVLHTLQLPTSLYASCYSNDGANLFVGGADGKVYVVDAVDARLLGAFAPIAWEIAPSQPQSEAERRDKPVEFITDVMPVLSKLGCNAGSCHGAKGGKNGFALSLRGYDPWFDYRALTDVLQGRRISRNRPEASLILQKPTGAMAHGGGSPLRTDDPRYETLRRWIAQGAVFREDAPRVVRLEVSPSELQLAQAGDAADVSVTAHYDDGSQREVSHDAFLTSSDEECVKVNGSIASAVRRGEAALLVRYEGSYAAVPTFVMGDREGFKWIQRPSYGAIDDLVDAKLHKLKLVCSDLCTDAEFLRRASLDLAGLPPTPQEIREFLADPRPSRTKREALVDRLLSGSSYVELQTNRWSDLLMVNAKRLGREGAASFRNWIRDQTSANVPYNQFVYAILSASGSNREHPAASYIKALQSPEAIAETSTQLFLGVRFNCNKCHDHPFERWTQAQYYELAAYFAR
ncbi:MAG: DUF1549 domain-containing protein, partial [Planctomycetales bacterium]|nr:DUF1549 domain-containing protein [Planctomycetales bacterium]